jgi:hypothetical protein
VIAIAAHPMNVCTHVWVLADDGTWECWHRVNASVWVNAYKVRRTKPKVSRPKDGRTEWRPAEGGGWELWRREIQSRWELAGAQAERPTICRCGSRLVEDEDGRLRPTHMVA